VVGAVDCNFCVSIRIEDDYSLENRKTAYKPNERLLEDDIRKRYSDYDPEERSVANIQGKVATKKFTSSYVSRTNVQLREDFRVAAVATNLYAGRNRTIVINITVE
jgi:hypothetical protein